MFILNGIFFRVNVPFNISMRDYCAHCVGIVCMCLSLYSVPGIINNNNNYYYKHIPNTSNSSGSLSLYAAHCFMPLMVVVSRRSVLSALFILSWYAGSAGLVTEFMPTFLRQHIFLQKQGKQRRFTKKLTIIFTKILWQIVSYQQHLTTHVLRQTYDKS